ncbi:C-type lectin domain family 4 member D isoform X2 [Salmo salar]|uniref:C-type lectin domain family 4 member D isoform X2 n=1 Tax=Salmo salar TaxID=8030 RepID=A0ABM3E8P4_SALSA|nr:C-type lectin domain family 4 member D-like isoform X2 [Salmo salar]
MRRVKSETHRSDGRLYRLAAVCFGVLCVLQVTLNISLRLAFFHSNREREQLNSCYNTTGLAQDGDQPDTSSIMDLCTERDQCRMNRNQLERERDKEKMDKKEFQERYTTLTTERDRLRDRVSLLTNEKVVLEERLSRCGTGRGVEGRGMAVPTMTTVLKCPKGWRMLGSSCYFLSTERKTWEESRLDCQNRGADLVIINSRQEQKFLFNCNKDFWIGLTDTVTEGTWKWVDGNPLTTPKSWGSGQPNGGGVENCVLLTHSLSDQGTWHDYPCSYNSSWICEI